MASATAEVSAVVHQAPERFGHVRARWTLALLQLVIGWLRLLDRSSAWRLLRRLGIRYKRGRLHLHSPDPDYSAKVAAIEAALAEVAQAVVQAAAQGRAGEVVVLYLDEVGVCRQPTVAQAYALVGRDQYQADLSHASNHETRVVGALDPSTGCVHYRRRSAISVAQLVHFFAQVAAAYPQARVIYLVCDNWPLHFHPELLATLVAQQTPFALRLPASWQEAMNLRSEQGALTSEQELATAAERMAARLRWHAALPTPGTLPIQLLPLPTYAPWLNPIEKVWHKYRKEQGHMHRHSDDWDGHRTEIDRWLDQTSNGSPALLRHCGLSTA